MIGPSGHRIAFEDLAGFDDDDASAAFEAFRRSAVAACEGRPHVRPACSADAALLSRFEQAVALGPSPGARAARAFFTQRFVPARLTETGAFFTGYYEPVVEGALTPAAGFTAPLLARPDDLHTFVAGEARPAWTQALSAARRAPDGTLSPYPDRTAIEDAIETGAYRPLVWLRDWVEVFLIHVQGSARVRLPDGRLLRLSYAGRNGHPYSSVGRLAVESGAIAAEAMSLDRLKAWLRAGGQGPGEAGRVTMQRNTSYIFFAAAADDGGETGPTGGAGLPLAPLRSIAVDRGRWPYGLPFFIDATLPWRSATLEPFRRLMIAQDTGSAIVGEARVDIFFGTGAVAGERAGGLHHHGGLVVLLPLEGTP